MDAMLCGKFSESVRNKIVLEEVTLDAFMPLLEYIYTEHAPIEDNDPMLIMEMADRYRVPRLITLCELYVYSVVDGF